MREPATRATSGSLWGAESPKARNPSCPALRTAASTARLFSSALTLLRWHHFLQYDSIYPTPHERQIRMEPEDTHTYWFYYFYR